MKPSVMPTLAPFGFGKHLTRMAASAAIMIVSARQIEPIAPNSATDLLQNIPGVYVNSSRDAVNSSVYTQGLNVGGGFYYVSLQEDGLPILAALGYKNKRKLDLSLIPF